METRPNGRVEIAGLRCPGRHGAYDGEQDQTTTFLIDIDARGDVREADGERFAAIACEVLAGPSRTLLERVTADVADAILAAEGRVDVVRVRVTKPDPPGLGAAAEAIALTRSRGARAPSAPSEATGPRRARG